MPIYPVAPGGPTLPIEGSPYPEVSAVREAIGTARDQSLGATMLSHAFNSGSTQIVPQADAINQLKAQNYDTTDVPTAGMTQGALLERMNRASQARQTQDDERRAGMGGVTRFSAGVVGGLGDPLNVVIAPIGGYSVTAVRAGLAGRVALGAVEGSAFSGANAEASNVYSHAVHLGDPDLTSADLMKNMMLGAAVGGVLNGAFGPRTVAHAGGGPVTLDMIDKLGERTSTYSKMTGVPVDDVVSKTGAVGRYQVEPGTAMQYGATQEQIDAGLLRDPTFNAKYAQKALDDLNKRFPNDPEAVAIGYEAGPGAAYRFIRSGRDYSVLGPNARAYAARVTGMPLKTRLDAAQTAAAQAASDSPVNVEPTIDQSMQETFKTNPFKIQDEHDEQVQSLETEAMQASVPKQNSEFIGDPDIQQMLRLIDARPIETQDADAMKTTAPAVDTEPGQFTPAEKPQIDPQLQAHLANDEADAKSITARLGTPEGENEHALYQPPEPHMIDGMPAEDHQKAVEAAVRCGLMRGGFE